jgi:hypothetical protein
MKHQIKFFNKIIDMLINQLFFSQIKDPMLINKPSSLVIT